MKGAFHVYHQYTIRVVDSDRDAFIKEMAKRGIGAGVYYPTPVHVLESFKLNMDLPETTKACKEVISIPVHPKLSQRNLEKIVKVINSISSAGS
jgi:dTDP-4-amino-4,6-dideoxygalactose transaminase